MSVCILSAGKVLTLAVSAFSLSWTHSVEKIDWQEDWQSTPAGLVMTMARVKGSGAGMEPGDDAVLKDGWWQWTPSLGPQPELRLAASGATGSGWTLCTVDGCQVLGEAASEPLVIKRCEAESASE